MKRARHSWLAWIAVALLAGLCGSLAILQYRWIGEISAAERERLQKELSANLDAFRRAFEERIDAARRSLAASAQPGGPGAWMERWHSLPEPIFSHFGLVTHDRASGGAVFVPLDGERSGERSGISWPDWLGNTEFFYRGPRFGPGPRPEHEPGSGARPEPPGQPVAALNSAYIGAKLAPELAERYLQSSEYDIAIFDDAANKLIFESSLHAGERAHEAPDAEMPLAIGTGRPGGGRGGPPPFRGGGIPPSDRGPRPEFLPMIVGAEHWMIVARHRAGSLEAIVAAARRRNIAASAGMLVLIVAIVAFLVRLSRQSEKLAALQMAFVTGVSHELRTPLTVIRTAAFNLRGQIAKSPDQVERYSTLIEEQSLKLTELVDQVLLFARTDSAFASHARSLIAVGELIEKGLEAGLGAATRPGIAGDFIVDKRIASDLPRVSVDEASMTQALRNLIDNAMKYSAGETWIGIRAAEAESGGRRTVEIHVADRGPGVPEDERERIFEAFFRGRYAREEQIHGTGLGLNLARRIVIANGGTLHVRDAQPSGAEFIVTLPAA